METYLVADKSCHVLGHTAHVPNFVVLDHGACERYAKADDTGVIGTAQAGHIRKHGGFRIVVC